MAEAVDLDPGPYRGTYKAIGGRPCLDLANLVSYRGTTRAHDWLVPAANVVPWAAAVGLDGAAGTGAREVDDLRRLREVVARTFLDVADGTPPDPGDVDEIGGRAAATWAQRQLRATPPSERAGVAMQHPSAVGAAWVDPAPTVAGLVALDAADLLTAAGLLRRVRACDECRWVFLDTSRNRSRVWCDPADCGNRARQRRHQHRRRP